MWRCAIIFQHVRLTLEGNAAPFYQKQNVLLLGPTGVGKTHLIRSAAELIGVPFVKADATKFSETGYVGAMWMIWCVICCGGRVAM